MAAGSTRSTTSVIEASAAASGSLEAIFSSARRSPAATSSVCLRSVMSMMLARIRLPPELGRRTKRTSLGISLPSASLCSHSKTGVSPRSAASMCPRAMPNDGVPSACSGGLTCSGPDAQQVLARQLEEVGGIVVAVDEASRFDVEHDHRFRRVLDQHAVARLAVLERVLRFRALRGVADADDVGRPALALHRADEDLGRHQLAATVPGDDFARGQVVVRRLLRGREDPRGRGRRRRPGQCRESGCR